MIFDRYVTVDWSASNRPKTGKDSVWICSLGDDGEPSVTNPPTRRTAEAAVRDLLVDAVERGERVLIGFDFPYAYPIGFAAALVLDGQPWRAVWEFLDGHVQDDRETNENNRFDVASAINARLTHHAFWGRPWTQVHDHLSARRDQVRYRLDGETAGLSEWREVELVLRRRGHPPHSTWKLFGAGSVGSQTITGIPVVSRLRHDPELMTISRVWPFEVTVPELPPGNRPSSTLRSGPASSTWPRLRAKSRTRPRSSASPRSSGTGIGLAHCATSSRPLGRGRPWRRDGSWLSRKHPRTRSRRCRGKAQPAIEAISARTRSTSAVEL